MAEDLGAIYKAACDVVVAASELRPEYSKDGKKVLKTFCNIGARRIAQAMGCNDFDDVNLNADAMHAIMLKTWKKVDAREAVLRALDGRLAYAVMTGAKLKDEHGHICAIRPEGMQASGTLGIDVPMVANIGRGDPDAPLVDLRDGVKTKRNWNCKASQAFPMKTMGSPDYFIQA